ncbi:MAG: hypothetical protein R2769_13535 [Saprospiraceae bacterium]
MTDKIGKAFQQIGMVTDINSGDINGDGKDEMIMVGEWSRKCIFHLMQSIQQYFRIYAWKIHQDGGIVSLGRS